MYTKHKKHNYQVCYKRNLRKTNVPKFHRFQLPSPIIILRNLGIKPTHTNNAGYYVCLCPFHIDSNPSLNVHSIDGHYKCHACDARGANIYDFYLRYTGKSPSEALKDLYLKEVK